MSYAREYDYEGSSGDMFAAEAALDERLAFIRRTYLHLFGAILAFIGLEALILNTPALSEPILRVMFDNWIFVLIAFMVVSWLAQKWAMSGASPGTQYAGLALYTLAEAIIIAPLLMIAQASGPEYIPTAGFLTLLIFCGLTVIVFVTKSDFSFLRNILWIGGLVALGLIVVSMFTSFSLGLVFVAAMIVLMSGWILYDTSNVLHHYHTDQHVAASLALFASLATLFWYVLRLVMILSSDD